MGLLPHDIFARDSARANDIFVLSMGNSNTKQNEYTKYFFILTSGGNDIALFPSCCTIVNILSLLMCTTTNCINSCTCGHPLSCQDYCYGFSTACLSNCFAWPIGYGYFLHMFQTKTKIIIEKLLEGPNPPKKVMVCMVYYLDEKKGNSW